MAEDYIAFCERLWRDWQDDKVAASLLPKVFCVDAAPEPYISFDAGAEPLIALTTNPGATMPHQLRAAVRAAAGPFHETDKYADAAPKLGLYYDEKLAHRPAGRRIEKLRKLSSVLGYDGVLQVEVCPFHSRSLPGKTALLQEIDECDLLGRYIEHLRGFLRSRPIVSVQAVSTLSPLGPETPKSSAWLMRIAEIAGLDLDASEFVPLVKKDSSATAAAWVSKEQVRVALVLVMGTNNLPANKGLDILVTELRKFWGCGGRSIETDSPPK